MKRNERVPTTDCQKMTFLTVFGSVTLIFDPWNQMLLVVTQDVITAHRLMAFAVKSDIQ